MKKAICKWKKAGITPFQMVEKIKQNPKYENQKIGFAGRLDPMAEGIMLFLIGDENKKRKDYEKLPKTYEFEVLFGISTDTYDVMGMPKMGLEKKISVPEVKIGKFIQAYPPYSYMKVKGKPLYWWSRQNRLNEISIPQKEVEIYKYNYKGQYKLCFSDLVGDIKERIGKTSGDFRQEQIISEWERLYSLNPQRVFEVFRFEVECSSGTYIRSIANQMGKDQKTGAIALKIIRTRVGKYSNMKCEAKSKVQK